MPDMTTPPPDTPKPMTEEELAVCTAMSARLWAVETMCHEAHALDRLVGEVRRLRGETMRKMNRQTTDPCCFDCGLLYDSPAWADVVLHSDDWRRISPDGDGNGLLCFNCINARLVARGLVDVPIKIRSGPMCFRAKPAAEIARREGATP